MIFSKRLLMKNRAFTLIELLVVIAIIALLLSVVLPSLRLAKEKAKEIVCRAHLKQLGLAATTYAQDYKGQFPPCHAEEAPGAGSYAVWTTQDLWLGAGHFYEYDLIDSPEIFYCPSNTNDYVQFEEDHPDSSNKGGGWPMGEIPDSLFDGQEWVQTTYHYRSLYTGQIEKSGSKYRSINFDKDGGGAAFMVDMFSDPERGVDYHHKDSYNAVYADGHSEGIDDKEDEIKDFNNGIRYNAVHGLQDKVWKRYFDLSMNRSYPEYDE